MTGNVGVCVPEFRRAVFGEFPSFASEADCSVRFRFGELIQGDLSGSARDQWWVLTPDSVDDVGEELARVTLSKVIPFLDSIKTIEDLLGVMLAVEGWQRRSPFFRLSLALSHGGTGDFVAASDVLRQIDSAWSEHAARVAERLAEMQGLSSPQ